MKQEERDILLQSLAKGQIVMNDSINKISRGLYGDPENEVKGLIERQKDDDAKFIKVSASIEANTKFRNSITKVSKTTLKSMLGSTIVSGGAIAIYFEKIKQFFLTILHL